MSRCSVKGKGKKIKNRTSLTFFPVVSISKIIKTKSNITLFVLKGDRIEC